VTAKSPLTGILGDSNSGGHFGPELKWAGYDHVIIEGRSENPVYLWIDDENVELRDARRMWGKTVPETYPLIWDEIEDPRIRIAAIGPAGENLVRYASIINDYGNAFGKTGMGAVMGSKNLKAVAVRGTKGVRVADPGRFKELARELFKRIQECFSYPAFSKYGTMTYLSLYDHMGRSFAKNAQQVGGIEYIDAYTAESMKQFATKNLSCFGCPVHCKHRFKVKKGPFSGMEGFGTEFCIMSAHGPSCGQADPAVVFKMNQLCNENGLCGDTSGIVLAAAFEWYQRGLITKKDTGGIALEWGDSEAQIEMLHKIIRREGFGDILAEGTAIAAKKIGKGAEKYISHSKGADLDQVDIRTLKGCALSDAVSSRGADPQRGWPSHEVVGKPLPAQKAMKMFGIDKGLDPNSYDEKGLSVSFFSSLCTLCDTLGICKFNTKWTGSAIGAREMADLVSAATGMPMDEREIFRVAARINNVERAFLVREGITRKDDTIHGRMMDEPVPSGRYKGEKLDRKEFARMLDQYYTNIMMRWAGTRKREYRSA
jgi:aldehyde:ferredoxin oxidoreductase